MHDKFQVPAQRQGCRDLALGRHVLVECYGCDHAILSSCDAVRDAMVGAARGSGATVLGHQFHAFEPQGVSGFVVIAESHFSVHAWPEHDYAAVDIFTCGEVIDTERAVELVAAGFGSSHPVISAAFARGFPTLASASDREAFPPVKLHPLDFTMSWSDYFAESGAWGIQCVIDLSRCAADRLAMLEAPELLMGMLDAVKLPPATLPQGAILAPRRAKVEGQEALDLVAPVGALSSLSLVVRGGSDVYADALFTAFVEPRDVAEYLCSALGAGSYRLQIAIRR